MIKKWIKQYNEFKKVKAQLTKKMDDLKEQIFNAVEKDGKEDDKGSLFLEVDEEIVKKEKRTSVKVENTEANFKFLRQKGLEDCIDTVEQINESMLEQAVLDEELSEEELKKIITKKITWALKIDKKKEE